MNIITKQQTIKTVKHGLSILALREIEKIESIAEVVDQEASTLQTNLEEVMNAIRLGESVGMEKVEWFLNIHASIFGFDPDSGDGKEPFIHERDRKAIIRSVYLDLAELAN